MNDEKLKILVVEDNDMFLNIAEDMLSGHNVLTAKTAKDGIDIFTSQLPDITFLDITLPDGNGLELLKQMRQTKQNAYIIMLTQSRLREDVLKAMDEGAEGYIMKPFSSGILEESINEYYKFKEKQK